MFELLATWIVWIAMLAAALAVGRPLTRLLGVGREDLFATTVWSMALGLLACGLALTGLGLAGCLHRSIIGVATAVAACWGVGEAFGMFAAWHMRVRTERDELALELVAPREALCCEPPPHWLSLGVAALLTAALGASFISACAPPTAGDALCYHLDLPKTFLAERAIVDVRYNDNATYPLLVEMWYAWGLALEGGVSAQLLHWTLGLLLAGAAVLLARPVLGVDWAWMAGAVVLLTPGVTNQMTAPLNDVALAAMTTLALVAWREAGDPRAIVDLADDEQARHRIVYSVLAGLMLGAALSIKYVALVFAIAVGVIWLFDCYWQATRRRELLQGAAVTLGVALCVAGVWYLRAWWLRGDPVYPFLSGLTTADGAALTTAADKTPLRFDLSSLIAVPWLLTFAPERFGGRGHELGPLLLATLPCLLLVRRLRGLAPLLAIAAVYALCWFALRQNVRFFYPVLPLAAVAIVWLWIELRRFPFAPRWLASGALAVMLVLGAAWPVYRARDKIAVAVGIESREGYLFRAEPTYEAAYIVNHLLHEGDRLLSQDYRAFYFDCAVTRESIYRRETAYDATLPADRRPEALAENLRRRGFTHVLVAENDSGSGIRYEPTLARLVGTEEVCEQNQAFARLANYRFRDADGGSRRYQLFLLR